jgi:hypothetical protein
LFFETSRDEIIAKAKKEGKLRVLMSLENYSKAGIQRENLNSTKRAMDKGEYYQ